jgi:hypothetical protein
MSALIVKTGDGCGIAWLASGTGLPVQGGRSYMGVNAAFTVFRDLVWPRRGLK